MDEDASMAAWFQLQQEEQQQLELAQRQLREDRAYENWLEKLENSYVDCERQGWV